MQSESTLCRCAFALSLLIATAFLPFAVTDETATDATASAPAIYRSIKADEVHFTETERGSMLVSLTSVPGHFTNTTNRKKELRDV